MGVYNVITERDIGLQSVASASQIINQSTARYAYISPYDNLVGSSPSTMYIGSGSNPWAGGYGIAPWITTSDERKKENISALSDKYLKFAKMLIPRAFTMKQGTSGRTHVGFIAQEVEKAMMGCGITDMEFAGLIKSPVYDKKLLDEDGNETGEYDTASEIIDYNYALRYEEFIPLLFSIASDQEARIKALEEKIEVK